MSNQVRLSFLLTCFGKLFIAGKNAKGVLKVYTLNDTIINRIKIGVFGLITIEADENGNHTAVERDFFHSDEHIFDASDLKNSEYEEQLIEFEVPLDRNLPPSVMLEEGSIAYHLYATMEEEFPDGTSQTVSTQANISVVSLVDCNTIPKAIKKKVVLATSRNSCICLQNQESRDSFQISPRAYVPGDCIKINAVINNEYSVPICYVQVALEQKVKLKYEDRTVKVKRFVSDRKRGSVMPGSVQVWHDEFLRIPPLPCTTYHKYIHVTYKLKLIPSKQNSNISSPTAVLELPVVIGNLPLESALSYFNALPRCESFGNKILPIPQPYQDYAKGENCIQPNNGNRFVPSYITYMTERGMECVELE